MYPSFSKHTQGEKVEVGKHEKKGKINNNKKWLCWKYGTEFENVMETLR